MKIKKMPKYAVWIFITIASIGLVGAYFFLFSGGAGADKMLTVRFYDANKNLISDERLLQQTMIGGTPNVAYVDLGVNLRNTGNRRLSCSFRNVVPSAFEVAFGDYSQTNPSHQYINIEPGRTASVISDLIDVAPFEPSEYGIINPIDFSLTVACTYAEGNIDRAGTLRLNMERDDRAEPGLEVSIESGLTPESALLKCSNTLSIPNQVLYLPFNNDASYGESSTLTHDFSGNNYNGVVSNAVWDPSGGKFGDGAFLFNGVNSLITIPDTAQLSPSTSSQKYTIAFWVKFNTFTFVGGSDTSGYNALHFIGKYSTNGDGREWYFRLHNATAVDGAFRGKRVSFYTFSPSQSLGTGSYFQPGISNLNGAAPDYAPGEWIFVVGVINGTHTKIYQNGVLRDADPLTNYNVTMGDTFAPFFIGRYDATTENYKDFDGSIDEVRVFSRDLTQTEITQLYNLNSCTYEG